MDGSPKTMSQLTQGGVKNLSGNFSAVELEWWRKKVESFCLTDTLIFLSSSVSGHLQVDSETLNLKSLRDLDLELVTL